MKPRRSPIFYVGDKSKLLPQLLPNFPTEIDRYVEPFLGGGAVSLNVLAQTYRLSDNSTHLISVHKRLRKVSRVGNLVDEVCCRIKRHGLTCTYLGDSVSARLISRFPKTYFAEANREAFLKLRSAVNSSQDPDPLDLYILVIYGFNRMWRFNSSGEFNVPVGNVDFNAKTAAALADFVEFHSKHKNVTLASLDFKNSVTQLDLGPNDFVYLDPPYLITQAEYNARWQAKDDEDLREVFESLHSRGVRVAMSNVLQYRESRNISLERWARAFRVIDVRSNYINRFDNRQKTIREVLIVNY